MESTSVKDSTSISSTGGIWYQLLQLATLGLFGYASYLGFHLSWKSGLGLLVAAVVAVLAGHVAWKAGDWFRKFVAPSYYFTHGVEDAFKKRVFWLIGPQSIAFVITVFFVVVFSFGVFLDKTPNRAAMDAAIDTPVSAASPDPAPVTLPVAESESPRLLSVHKLWRNCLLYPTTAAPPALSPADGPAAMVASMLNHAMNPLQLAEIKAQIESLPKPATGDRKSARALNDQGLSALKAKNHAEAVALLSRAVEADPSDAEVVNNHVHALIQAGNIADAELAMPKALMLSPGRSSAWVNLAEMYAQKAQVADASKALIVAFQFSSNKDRTLQYLKTQEAAGDSPAMQEAAQAALRRLAGQ
ncbi:MAG: tetratricopeptide repeat protein [Betaproteobacteria bacterium]|nr:tetratricopeptide repeat protein [Betaproteobacteria bacterium]